MITLEKIDKHNPCVRGRDNLIYYYGTEFKYTIREFLSLDNISYDDKIWLMSKVLRIDTLQRWSIACASTQLCNTKDERVLHCLEITESFLNRTATIEELESAAVWAARAAAWSTVWSAESAAESAAWAARAAAWSAESAARAAAWSAESAAESAARAARSARLGQEEINIILLSDCIDQFETKEEF